MEMKFYICKHCGNIVAKVRDRGVPVMCCGEPMAELIPGTTDAAVEKHVPVVHQEGNTVTVTVGSVEHPMTEAHLIEWIVVRTTNGVQIRKLTASDKPTAVFVLSEGEELIEVLEYCNLHGLWKA